MLMQDAAVILPPDMRCAAHRLNPVATEDVKDVFENSICKKIFRSMMVKLQKLLTSSLDLA